ncbi:EAL domain-containing protein [Tropicibacter naphthalenivorans]|uniref:Cyclic di-GMP phosphodiesterase YfgF n=1 Tax=Tropicibacter naphthalenivorans TaxID=441103 RepID=A0A0P1G090_9RHOB|nr:EAL domain-containing protein [Tropicibacter naphthalenivorans]CUH75126.1 Cyclic di-GMP phosphodiesterase YfgF [Tropicibacter naphthalenivorans]SMC46509.1 EAL domain, c-di-GMP-specific phosphodiesterase class I (or its enzymatically inactive variant) [Tropicibacter naphthalenivorans]
MARVKGKFSEGARNALEHAVSARDRNTMDMVQRAIQHRQVMLAFQPVVQTTAPDHVAFYEGLIRVLDETGRVIPAAEFINAVEDTEFGRMLDCIALEKGLAELERVPALRLSINMSARSVGYKKWMRTLTRGLQNDPTVAERLILEITETSAMTVPELVTTFMKDLQSKGITFAMDDFGSGYTALRHFKDFSFDILKIDGEFSSGIAQDPDNQVLVGAIVKIAEQFDLFTVAERVETQADADVLRALGVDCLQGYLFAAPTVNPPWRDEQKLRKSAR